MKRLLVLFFVLVSSLIFGATDEYDDLTLFIKQLVENGNLDALVKVKFHIADSTDQTSYRDLEAAARILVSDGEDFYVEFFEPVELEGIAMVYLAREEVLFSLVEGVAWKQYRLNYEVELAKKLVGQFFRGLMDPTNFSWEVESQADRNVYKIVSSETRLKFLGLLSGGGYLPNLMRIAVSLVKKEGYFPLPEYLKITDRLEKEYLFVEFENFEMRVDKKIFLDLRERYYESFQN